jgi:hypothetical protein
MLLKSLMLCFLAGVKKIVEGDKTEFAVNSELSVREPWKRAQAHSGLLFWIKKKNFVV